MPVSPVPPNSAVLEKDALSFKQLLEDLLSEAQNLAHTGSKDEIFSLLLRLHSLLKSQTEQTAEIDNNEDAGEDAENAAALPTEALEIKRLLTARLQEIEQKAFVKKWFIAGTLSQLVFNFLVLFIFPSVTAPLSAFIAAIAAFFFNVPIINHFDEKKEAQFTADHGIASKDLRDPLSLELDKVTALLLLAPGLAVNTAVSLVLPTLNLPF